MNPRLIIWPVLVGSWCPGCQPDISTTIMLPDLSGLEAPVARKLRTTHAILARDLSGQTIGAFARALHAHAMLLEAEQAYLAAASLAQEPGAYEYLHLAGLAASESSPTRATKHLARAASLRPNSPATQMLRGRMLESLARLSEAESCFRAVVQYQPSSHAFLGLGRIKLARGDAKAALQDLNEAQRLQPDHREVHEARARCLNQLGNTQASRAAARRAGDLAQPTPFPDPLQIQIASENVSSEARLHRGAALAQAGETAAAIENFEGVLEVRRDHIEALDYLALLVQKTAPQRAIGYLNRILARKPAYPRALELRARVKLSLQDRAGAERDLQNLLRVLPDHAWARQQLRR